MLSFITYAILNMEGMHNAFHVNILDEDNKWRIEMKKLNREAKIFVNGRLAGILSEFRGGKNQRVVFQYEEDYLKDGSLNYNSLEIYMRISILEKAENDLTK